MHQTIVLSLVLLLRLSSARSAAATPLRTPSNSHQWAWKKAYAAEHLSGFTTFFSQNGDPDDAKQVALNRPVTTRPGYKFRRQIEKTITTHVNDFAFSPTLTLTET
jgi:hypothetical protein